MTSRAHDHYIDDVLTRLQDQVEAQADEIRLLRALVRTMVDEDPNDMAADGGVTVLDVWRKEARRALEPKP